MTMQVVETGAIRKTLVVRRSVEDAFALFTEGIAEWWPFDTHSIGGKNVETAVVEPRVGGRVYERHENGAERDWADVLVWEPPRRIVLAWNVDRRRPEATELELRFSPEGDATRVELEHRGWERLGADAAEARASYDSGWDRVLKSYAAAGA